MKPLIAIELDDDTHDRPDRQKRDIFVNSLAGRGFWWYYKQCKYAPAAV